MTIAGALAALAACGAAASPAAADDGSSPSLRPGPRASWIAEPVHTVPVRMRAGTGPVAWRLAPIASWGGGPLGLLVLERRTDPGGRAWLHVRLPGRPNGAHGWISADHARLRRTRWRIEISTRRRVLRLLHRGRVVHRARVVVGAPATPTPHGRFAVAEAIAQPRGGLLGPWALHLTAHSTVLDDFGGGPGRVALHGRGGASLRDRLGTARSHGCVRVGDRILRRLVRVARPGTPVSIRG